MAMQNLTNFRLNMAQHISATQGILTRDHRDLLSSVLSSLTSENSRVFPGTFSPLSAGEERRRLTSSEAVTVRTAGGRPTDLQPEYSSRHEARAVPTRPPAKVAVLAKPKTELSCLSGNQEDKEAVTAGQQGARRPPVRARPRQREVRLEARRLYVSWVVRAARPRQQVNTRRGPYLGNTRVRQRDINDT